MFQGNFHISSSKSRRMSLGRTKLTKNTIFYEAYAIISGRIHIFPAGNNCRPAGKKTTCGEKDDMRGKRRPARGITSYLILKTILTISFLLIKK